MDNIKWYHVQLIVSIMKYVFQKPLLLPKRPLIIVTRFIMLLFNDNSSEKYLKNEFLKWAFKISMNAIPWNQFLTLTQRISEHPLI
jgi:hypothetical protein